MPSAPAADVVLGVDGTATVRVAGRSVLVLRPRPGRVEVGLAVPPLERVVGVSGSPGAAVSTLHGAAVRALVPEATVDHAARGALGGVVERTGAWAPPPDAPLVAAIGGAAMPLLGASYLAGAAAVAEVPKWVESILMTSSARAGATAAFGAKATRPVVRAFAGALLPTDSGALDLGAIGLALAGADVLEPDCLARLLAAGRLEGRTRLLPDRRTLALIRRTLVGWGPHRAERVLIDAARRPDGVDLLVRTVTYYRDLRGHVPAALPNSLQDLHDGLRVRVATRPPDPVVAELGPDAAEAPHRRRAPAGPAHRIYRPAARLGPVTPETQLAVPTAIRSLDGAVVDGLTFTVPRLAADLTRWGHLLSNCLHDYGPSCAHGSSVILGILRGDQLRYAVEITAARTVRQFVGPANRPPEPWVRIATVRELVRVGALEVEDPVNAPWLVEVGPVDRSVLT